MSTTHVDELAVGAIFTQAVGQHRSGNLSEAERAYLSILAVLPDHPEAHHNLGILALQTRRASDAIAHVKAAIAGNPRSPQYWISYQDVLVQAGRLADLAHLEEQAVEHGLPREAVEVLAMRLRPFSAIAPADYCRWMPDLLGDSYTSVLSRLHEALRPTTYLEIGVETGTTLALSRCRSLGIDPSFQFRDIGVVRGIVDKPTLLLYQMTSDDFFARLNPAALLGGPIDFAFLDGMHRCEYLLRDFTNTERHCHPDSVIALHDCLPIETPMAERAPGAAAIEVRRQAMWTGDVWRTALLLKRRRPDLHMCFLDAAPTGLVLITHLDPENTLIASEHDGLVREMLGWSLEDLTLAGYYREVEVEPEIQVRHPDQLLSRLRLPLRRHPESSSISHANPSR